MCVSLILCPSLSLHRVMHTYLYIYMCVYIYTYTYMYISLCNSLSICYLSILLSAGRTVTCRSLSSPERTRLNLRFRCSGCKTLHMKAGNTKSCSPVSLKPAAERPVPSVSLQLQVSSLASPIESASLVSFELHSTTSCFAYELLVRLNCSGTWMQLAPHQPILLCPGACGLRHVS